MNDINNPGVRLSETQIDEQVERFKAIAAQQLQGMLRKEGQPVTSSLLIRNLQAVLQESIQKIELEEYDPALCIEAGELRAMGIQLSDNIPDCAWVERWSIKWEVQRVEEEGMICCVATFNRPFRWLSLTIDRDMFASP